MNNANALSTEVSRNLPPEPAPSHVNPLLRLHLLLYGRYKWAIILGLLLAVGGMAAVWKSKPDTYEVKGAIRVKPYIPPVLNQTDLTGILPMFETFVSLQVSLLQSQRVQDQASNNAEWKALGLTTPRWGSKIPAENLEVAHPRNSELIIVSYTDPDPKVAAIAVKCIIKAYEITSNDTEGNNSTERLKTLEDLRTTQTNQKRAVADQILALANEFGSDDLQRWYQFKLDEQNKLESQLRQVALDISIAQAAMGTDPTTLPTTPESQPATVPATAPESQPATAPAVPEVTREDVARIDSRMRSLLDTEMNLTMQLLNLSQLGDKNPSKLRIKNELQVVQEQITALLAIYQERANKTGVTPVPVTPVPGVSANNNRSTLLELRARESNIRSLFERVQTETKALGQKDLQIRKLKTEQDAIAKKLDETSTRIDQLNLEATMANRINILSTGETPTAPLPNKRYTLMAVVGMLGLAAGAGLIALRGLADRRVSSLLHMQQLAPSMRVLGMLPILPEDLTDPVQISLAAHCVHQIRNLLEAVPAQDQGRTLAITSPSAGDGKTSLTLALGLSFAASGTRTLLIDCDMVGCGLTRRLNAISHRRIGSILQRQGLLTERQVKEALRIAANSPKKFGEILVALGYLTPADVQRALADQQETSVGLLDALAGEPLTACITSAVMENLFILPVGDASPDHTQQLSAKALRRLLKEASSQYDLIIIDSGPVLGSLEASVASREADEVILTIARGASSMLVTRAVDLLASLGAHFGGVVFNRATSSDVAYSKYGSAISFRSLRPTEVPPSPAREPRGQPGASPRLGPVAAAVAKETTVIPHANGSSKTTAAEPSGNGTASDPTPAGTAPESTRP